MQEAVASATEGQRVAEESGKVLVVEPRRLACRSLAARVAQAPRPLWIVSTHLESKTDPADRAPPLFDPPLFAPPLFEPPLFAAPFEPRELREHGQLRARACGEVGGAQLPLQQLPGREPGELLDEVDLDPERHGGVLQHPHVLGPHADAVPVLDTDHRRDGPGLGATFVLSLLEAREAPTPKAYPNDNTHALLIGSLERK